ncbi:MAG TPA: hypothetical protein VJO34_07660 [Methylomirabilota bacterium]|nr:hypothetical protein [Methylomirabilota bacterium]
MLKTVLDALATRVAPPGEIPEKLADDLKAILGQLLLPATVPNPIDENKVRASLDRLVNYLDHLNPEAVANVLAEKLKITPPSTPQTSEGLDKLFRSPSPTQVLDLIQVQGPHGRMISLRNAAAALSWTGAMPGIEFGFFDVGESGVRSVRLSPLPLPPYLPPPVYSALGYFFFGIIGALVGASADYGPLLLAEILYSAFPGYPAFFDVPLEEGALFTHLPVAWDEQDSNPLAIWPTSGSLPSVPGRIDYLRIFPNLRSILAEDFGNLAELQHLNLKDLPVSKISALAGELKTNLPAVFNPSALGDDSPLKHLAPPALCVVRPTALAFPERLLNPAPVMISDPRRSRAFLLVPREGDSKNTLAVLGPQTKKEATASEPRQIDWYATPLYHSEAGQFLQIANRRGISDLYESAAEGGSLQAGGRKNGFDDSFVVVLPPALSGEVVRTDCVEGIHFTGATGVYNWELFFHLPLQFARQLAANLQFTEANVWLHKIFNPTVAQGDVPARFWRFKALHDESSAGPPASIGEILRNAEISGPIEKWRANPFDAHAIAQTRAGAYQRATVMQTIDTLVAWGDKLFRENKQESINEAAMLYLTAMGILGERPPEVAPPRPAPRTYNSLRRGGEPLNPFGGALVSIENLMVGGGAAPNSGSGSSGTTGSSTLGPLSGPSVLYFGIPANEKLRGYWDTIEGRLFGIRHSLDIQGRPRTGLLGAGGWGAEGAEGIAGSISPWTMSPDAGGADSAPIYRFTFALQKANEFCAEVKSLGGALLSAYEKRDAEALARLRSEHEIRILEAAEQVRAMQIDEASAALEAAEYSREGARIRMEYYDQLSGEFMNAGEVIKETLSVASSVLQIGSGMAELAAATIHAMPDFAIDVGGKAGFPMLVGEAKYSFRYGASHIAAAISAGGRALSVTSSVLGLFSSLAGTQATYQRRMQEWLHQRDLAANEVSLFEKQIESANIRLQIAKTELKNHGKQITNAREVATFMREKFTNEELYQWMVEELSRTYMETYELGYGLAKNALRSYQHENPDDDDAVNYLSAPNWDSLREGLLAGESLQLQLRRMENAWLARGVREAELVKHVSLHQQDPETLIRLRQTGICFVNLPERLFDEDHPGQYLRRIKSVSLTIPCVVGPYTSVNCRLTLEESRIRIKPEFLEPGDPYTDKREIEGGDDPRFVYREGGNRLIATSSAQNDSGLFELNLRDERYLPFEGEGAISHWRLELPKETNRFEFATISDVILHLKYTAREARDDGGELRRAASLATFGHELGDTISPDWQPQARVQSFSARAEFSTSWSRFLRAEAGTSRHVLEFDLAGPRFPFTPPDCGIELLSVEAALLGPAGTGEGWKGTWFWNETADNFALVKENVQFKVAVTDSTPPEERLGGLYSARLDLSEDWRAHHDPLRRWRITLEGPSDTAPLGTIDVLLLCEYRVVSKVDA